VEGIRVSAALRIGLVGAGFLAATRARCYRRVHGAPVVLAAVCARTAASARAFAAQHAVDQVCDSAEALFARGDLDLVDLCVPNALHRPLAVAALASGKHVVCTKPLCAYVGQDLADDAAEEVVATRAPETMHAVATAEADSMIAAAQASRKQLFYAENWLFAPAYQKALALAATRSDRALELRGWEAHGGSHAPASREWRRSGGGALLRLGSHAVAAMLHWKHAEGLRLGGQPTRVVAVTGEVADPRQSGARVESWGCAVLHFDDGSRGVVYGSDLQAGGMQSRFELRGEGWQLECNLSPHDQLRAFASRDDAFPGQSLQEKLDTQAGWSTPLPDEDWSSGQQAMCQSFCDALRGADSIATASLGRDVVRVIYSAYRSAREGRRVALDS
jgi:predicted dehydrogenase